MDKSTAARSGREIGVLGAYSANPELFSEIELMECVWKKPRLVSENLNPIWPPPHANI